MTKKKVKVKNLIAVVLFLLFFIIFVISIVRIVKWNIYNKKNREIQTNINKNIKVIKDDNEEEDNKEEKYVVDFKALKRQNNETVAYLKVPNTNIDTVVVKGSNNSFYLNHNFKKEWNYAGWIFADYRNKFDGSDKNIVIYGHDTQNGSMFGQLKKILTKEWYTNDDNKEIVLVTEDGVFKYQVFSVYSVIKEDYYNRTYFNSIDEYEKFLSTIKGRSIYDFKVDVTGEDAIVTLSTCKKGGKERIALHAKKII